MSHIPEQINKINKNIIEAESILMDLKRRPKSENVAEQIEHFESMLNKLNSLKDSYLQLSSQFDVANDLKKSLIISTGNLNNNTELSNLENVNGPSSTNASNVLNIRNMLSSVDELEQLKHERDRLKRLLQERGLATNIEGSLPNSTSNLEVDVLNGAHQLQISSPISNVNEIESDINDSPYTELSFYVSILNHHIDIGSKMVDMVQGLTLNENVQQGITLLKDVMQRLVELRKRFLCVQSARESIENQEDVDSDLIKQEIETFSTISDDLKINFATGVKCFKSAMDIIQAYLDPSLSQPESHENGTDENELRPSLRDDDFRTFSNEIKDLNINYPENFSVEKKSKTNNPSDSSSEHNNADEDDVNNDAEDEDSIDSCHEKDQDESMEIGVISANTDPCTNHLNHDAVSQLRMQTEIEQKEILRLLEEKRVMQQKLADLKRAKEMAQNQMMSLVQTGNIYEDFSGFLRMCQENELDNPNHSSSIAQRPESLDLKTGNMVNEMGSLLKLLSDIKVDVNNDTCLPNHISTRSTNSSLSKNGIDSNSMSLRPGFNNNESPNNMRSYNPQNNQLLPEISLKNEELQQQTEILQQSQSRIQQLQEILNRIKKDSISLDDSLINESNDQYLESRNIDREISSNGRPVKGRDSVTFQEPVATFIANDELYENMREVRMRREELRDLSARNSNSDPRSPAGRVIDSGNAPGAPPEVPTRIPVTNHDTASQDRTTAATWGSSSGGGDDYEENVPNNPIPNENIRIRSTGNRVSPLSNVNDEGSRVAPIGQSSTFRNKAKDSSYIKNVIDTDFANLKSQIENIATMCRNMALEQNRLARDISDMKRGSSPRINNGPDLVVNPAASANVAKHSTHASSLLTDDNLQNWTNPNNGGVPLTNMSSSVRNGNCLTTADSSNNFCSGMRPIVQIDSNWDEASISSSNAIQLNKQSAFYYSPNNYQHILNQQNMLLQSHSMFMKLQMSLIASQLEQQRLMCNVSMQQNNCPYLQYPSWQMRGIAPPFYPPPGPLSLSNCNMLQPNPDIVPGSQHSNFNDPDYILYSSSYQSEPREIINTSNPNTTSNMNVNSWKNASSGRNMHRN